MQILIELVACMSLLFVITSILLGLILDSNQMYAMTVIIKHKKYMSFNYISIVIVRESDYRIHFWLLTKYKAIDRMKSNDLTK